jgi:ribonuclease P protein component
MLPKKTRLTTALFDQVFKSGRVQHSERFWMRSFLLPAGFSSRFAVAVSKKVAPTAVERNKSKRIVYKAIEMFGNDILLNKPHNLVIFGVKTSILDVSLDEIHKELINLFEKRPKIS